MKRKTKRFTVTLAALALFLLSTCIPGPPDDYEDFVLPEFTDVEYSPDGSSVTIYLDGSAPVRNSRAINLRWAQIGYDFFEVAFLSGGTVVRSVWETGHAAGVSGVARGVDYALAVPGAGQGPAAILFVGKKSDKTLLALGRLTHVNNGLGTVAGTEITADTRSVTFTVAAIDVGVRYKRDNTLLPDTPSAPVSSFLTAAINPANAPSEANMTTPRIRVGSRHFPVFRFPAVNRVGGYQATYTFKVYDPPNNGIATMDNIFRAGIILAGPAELVLSPPEMNITPPNYHLHPRYPFGGGDWGDTIRLPVAKESNTVVSITNNQTAGNAFINPVNFTFGINADNASKVFSFSFQVPVYPLTNAGSPGTWYLRPGYDSYKYDLDDGVGGTGGAILIGTGDFEDSTLILWVKPPDKGMYPDSTFLPPDGFTPNGPYLFDLYGVMAELRVGNDVDYSIIETLLSVPPKLGYDDYNASLKFYVTPVLDHENRDYPIIRGDSLLSYFLSGPNTPNPVFVENGELNIAVDYTDSSGTLTTQFSLFWYDGSTPTADNIPPANRLIIANDNELTNRLSAMSNNAGNYILVFFNSITLPTFTLNGNGDYYVIIIAAKPDVVVTGSIGINNNGNSTFYLGKWPFNDTLSAQGLAITSYPLKVSTGSYFLNRTGGGTVETVEGPGFSVVSGSLIN